MEKADIGLVGLAVMGENLILNMESHGFSVGVFNRTVSKVDRFIEGRAKGKNIVGCVPGKKKLQWRLTAGVAAPQFARMILDLYKTIAPRLTIIDAVVSMEGNGPGNGEPRQTDFIAAASDAVTLDTIMSQIVGAEITQIPVLKEALKDDLPSTDLAKIEVLGESISDVKIKDFKFSWRDYN